jgi:acyl-CoA dehydrogenase
VTEAFDLLRSSGYLALPVPRELGGPGATVAEITRAQAELARHCASTALASSMHLHVVATNVHRWRHGQTAVEPMLKRVANEGIVVVSTGGTDGAFPSGTAVRVDDGWRVSGRKTFASQAPVGDVVSTWFPTEGPGEREILGMGIPMSAPGLEIVETWDTLGMRGTGSHDLVFTDVFVADKQVAARRPHGELDPLLRLSFINAMTIVAGTYWGVAERAAMLALEGARAKADRASAATIRLAGAIEAERATLRWTMLGLLDDLGPDPHDAVENVAAVMLAKRTVAERGLAVADLAMELASGPSYFRTRPLEQCWRDLRAAKYHPWTPETTLHQVGRLALGLPAEP